jgi:hypothetical protein
MGLLKQITLLNIYRLIACVVLVCILGINYGVIGIAIGLVVPEAVGCVIYIPWLIGKKIHLRYIELLKCFIVPIITGIIISLTGYILTIIHKPTTIYILAVECMIVGIMFIYILSMFGLDKFNRKLIINKIFSMVIY